MNGLTLEGRVAVVTGGAGGIGTAISRELAELGAKVVVVDLDEVGANRVADELGGSAFHCDLADSDSIDRVGAAILDQLGAVDVLVNNAGWDKVEPFLTSVPATWDKLIAINLRAAIQLTHLFLAQMQERRFGRLIFVSSDAARVGSSGEAVYSACKAGLVGFAKTIARESARHAVTSNVVCPGPSETPLLLQVASDNPKLVESLKRAIPLGRLGQPTDVAGIVAFMCSERAGYITGQTMSVSGGLTMI
jgi:2-hydroxycyclohexanecarboxyl-CoA dehydrogenase